MPSVLLPHRVTQQGLARASQPDPLFKNSEDDPAAEITAGPPVRQGQGGPMQRLCQKLTIKPLRLYWGPAI